MRTPFLILLVSLLLQQLTFAGKPWRPDIDVLIPESSLIITGKVLSLDPSLISDTENRRYAVATIEVSETLLGEPSKFIFVAVETPIRFDETGLPLPLSSAWRYELKANDHSYLFFLTKPENPKARYYLPAYKGSGIIDLSEKSPSNDPADLKRVRDYLKTNLKIRFGHPL